MKISQWEQKRDLIREEMRNRRAQLSIHQLRESSLSLSQHLSCTPEFIQSRKIAAYWAIQGEMDTHALITDAQAKQKRIYLPVLREKTLLFAPFNPKGITRKNRFGIPEPQVEQSALLEPEQLDLVLVPLVAFDRNGNRLGMGGGYYDRSFAFKQKLPNHSPPLLVGISHQFQQQHELQTQAWDVPLNMVITERGVIRPLEQSEALLNQSTPTESSDS